MDVHLAEIQSLIVGLAVDIVEFNAKQPVAMA